MNLVLEHVIKSIALDKFTIRGLLYSGVSFCGLGYEIIFVQPARVFLLVMYGIVFLIGMICIFYVKETNEQN